MTILYINNNLLVKVKYLFNFNIKIISRILKKNSIDRAWKSKQREASFDPVYRDCILRSIDRVNYLCLPCKQQTDARGENDEDETRKARDTLMTRLWPRIEHCALESVTKRTNATLLVLSACLKLGVRVWTRRKMGGKVGLICGSCWSGKYSMYIIIIILSRFSDIRKCYLIIENLLVVPFPSWESIRIKRICMQKIRKIREEYFFSNNKESNFSQTYFIILYSF